MCSTLMTIINHAVHTNTNLNPRNVEVSNLLHFKLSAALNLLGKEARLLELPDGQNGKWLNLN